MEVLPLSEQMKNGNYPVLNIGYCEKISLRRHCIDYCMQFAFPKETRARENSLFNKRRKVISGSPEILLEKAHYKVCFI